jgi:hypothetical protein
MLLTVTGYIQRHPTFFLYTVVCSVWASWVVFVVYCVHTWTDGATSRNSFSFFPNLRFFSPVFFPYFLFAFFFYDDPLKCLYKKWGAGKIGGARSGEREGDERRRRRKKRKSIAYAAETLILYRNPNLLQKP